MKKNRIPGNSAWIRLPQKLLMMNLRILFLVCMVNTVCANGFSQLKKLDVDFSGQEMTVVLNYLSDQVGYEFVYRKGLLNDKEKVSLTLKEVTAEQVLDALLKTRGYDYEIIDRMVVIRKGKSASLPAVPQQVRQLRGKVLDKNGEVLPGVSVFIKGTSLGVATDIEGKFLLSVPANEHIILVFSFIGMKTQELRLNPDKNEYTIILQNDSQALEGVVVTGFGNKSQASFTGAAQTISRDQLLIAGNKNLLQSLQAFIPGMQLVENNERGSDPNTRPEILIRGRSSFTEGSNIPTFIVDGAEVSADYVFDMDINDVETATVLKDAAASALYGAKAANGVVVITTRPMSAGKMKVTYSGTYQLSVPDLSDYHLLNPEQKLEYEYRAGLYTSEEGLGVEQYDMDAKYNAIYQRIREGVNTDWMSYPLRNSFTSNHNITVYGGDEYVRYNLGVRYGNDRGVMLDSDRKRYSLIFKLSYSKNDAIYIQNYTTISGTDNTESPYGSFREFVNQNPYDRAYNIDGTLNNSLTFDKANPLYEATLGSYDKGSTLSINDVLDLKVQLAKGVRVEGSFSLNKYLSNQENFVSPESKTFKDSPVNEAGSITVSNSNTIDYQGKLLLTYNQVFDNGTLISLIAGGNIEHSDMNRNGYTGIGIFSDKLAHPSFATKYPSGRTPSGSQDIERSVGGFVNLNTIYKDRYFADVSVRYEGSSKFGSDQRYAPFWSFGLGWNIHKEKFFSATSTDRLKLRASIGYLGNASFSPYQAITTYEYRAENLYDNGIGAVPITIGNTDLKWERTMNYNVGVDVNLFDNRFDMTLDYYKKITDNLLLSVTKAPSIGVGNAIENMGKIDNSGIEFRTRIIAIRNRNWDWTISLTASHNQNKIRQISDVLKEQNEKNNAKKSRAPLPVYEEGESISAIKAVRSGGIDPATGQEIFIGKDGRPTFTYDYRDKIVFGDSDPKVYGIFSSYLTYKNIQLNMMFDYKLKATIYNQTLVTRVEGANPQNNADERVFNDRWKEVGDRVKYKNIADQSIPDQTSRFIEDEYTLSLRSLSLSYDFNPALYKKLHLSRLRVQLMTNDLFRLSTVKQERGFDYPFARSYQFSMSATF